MQIMLFLQQFIEKTSLFRGLGGQQADGHVSDVV